MTLTVAELRKALEGLPDDMPVIAWDEFCFVELTAEDVCVLPIVETPDETGFGVIQATEGCVPTLVIRGWWTA